MTFKHVIEEALTPESQRVFSEGAEMLNLTVKAFQYATRNSFTAEVEGSLSEVVAHAKMLYGFSDVAALEWVKRNL